MCRLFTLPEYPYFPKLFGMILETVFMAFVATVAACVISFPISMLAASNCSPHPVLGLLLKAIASVFRSIPDLLLALILASALGLGKVSGVVALTVAGSAFLVKAYAEALEVVDRKAVDGISAAGGDWLAQRTVAVVPQAAPDLLGLSLYAMDSNLRAAAILGAVGAGGIGYDLSTAVRLFQFGRLGSIIVAIYVAVGLVDALSSWVRRRIA